MAAFSGSARANHLILETVIEATGTEPTASAQIVEPQLGNEVLGVRGRPVVVPQQGIADEFTILVEGYHAVLLATDGERRHSIEEGWIGCRLLIGR